MRKACLDMVHELTRRDDRVLYVGSDPGAETLDSMRKEFPQRFLIEGIAEQNLIGMAAGLSMEGYIPYVNTIATFLTRRCFEQVAVDLCLHNLPVRLVGNGGGLVYAPLGPTHMAVEDIAIMRALPNMTVVAVADAPEMRRFMDRSLDWKGPIYIRVAKGGDPVVTRDEWGFEIGKAVAVREGRDVLFVSTGIMLGRAQTAADRLAADGISCGILHCPTVKPFDTAALMTHAGGVELVVTLEEHTRIGGLGSAVLETLSDSGKPMPRVTRLGIQDAWIHHYGSQDALMKDNGLDPEAIVDSVRGALRRSNTQ
jgi:transketolase